MRAPDAFGRLAIGTMMIASPPRLFDYIARLPWYRGMLDDWINGLMPLSQAQILEVGCGPGNLSASLQATGATVTGIDRSARMVAMAQRKYAAGGADFALGDALAVPFPEGRYRTVIAASLVNVVPDPAALIAEMSRVTAEDGEVSVLFPTTGFDRYKVAEVADHLNVTGLSYAALDTWQALSRKLEPEMVSGFFKAADLTDISVRPLLLGAAACVTGRKRQHFG